VTDRPIGLPRAWAPPGSGRGGGRLAPPLDLYLHIRALIDEADALGLPRTALALAEAARQALEEAFGVAERPGDEGGSGGRDKGGDGPRD
jgi:hypothetical protein